MIKTMQTKLLWVFTVSLVTTSLSLRTPSEPLGTVDLPGVDVLSVGYDAASWSVKNTPKFAIFDLTAPGAQVFVWETNKTYTVPAMASVVTDGPNSRRVEDSCEDVATSFASFLHTYQESTSIDIGFHTSNFSLGFEYHKDVQEVYESITDKFQAFGISRSWWGMFEITLPPPFLMANYLHPVFQTAKTTLAGIGVPKTEKDQEIYNQVCCSPASFGTHFVAHVIVGAQATILTAVNNSFHSEYSNKTVSEQISIGFEYEKLKLSGDHRSKDFEHKMMKEFKNSSHTRLDFSPSIVTNSSDTPWLMWEAEAQKQPVVVNMTVVRISELFIDLPEVRTHMEKTIQFYVENARAPKLSEINGLLSEHKLEEDSIPAPGLGTVGCGFDVTRLSPRICLYDTTEPGDTWSNPIYPNITYDVPLGFYATNTPESLLLNGTILYKSVEDWASHSFYVEHHHSSGFLGFGGKSETKTTEEKYRFFYAHSYYLALSLRQIAWYTLSLSQFPQPPFVPIFTQALDVLPVPYDSGNTTVAALYEQFFDSFGTHVVIAADMGGAVWAEDWFESCLTRIYKDVCITDQIRKNYDPFGIVHKDTDKHQCDEHITKDYENYSTHHFEMLGGTAKVNVSQWEEWALTVKNNPLPVKYSLRPMHELLLRHDELAEAMQLAMDDYLAAAEKARSETIDELEKLRPPPPPVCQRPGTVTRKATQVAQALVPEDTAPRSTSSFEQPDPRAILCPITGYNGSYCPPVAGTNNLSFEAWEKPTLDGLPALPRGVGLTLDTSTGQLKLPVIDYSKASGTVWTDPITKVAYAVPVGMSLDTNITAENTPQVNVFRTEEELEGVWEKGYETGTWMGGEFGHSQSLTQLYTNFFSKEQSAAINQYPSALYRLRLEKNWETQLNTFAQTGLKDLPSDGDQKTYDLFFDTWGTHIATDTLVGGMYEMQLWLKNCIWGSPYLTGGLSEEDLQKYLTFDITKAPIQDNYYLQRRKMSLDHFLGGNPEETKDKEKWQATVGANPALLKVYSHTPWHHVANASGLVSQTVVQHLEDRLKARMDAQAAERQRDKEQVEKERTAELLGPRSVVAVVAHGRRGSIAPVITIGKTLTMKGYSDCPPGLPDGTADKQCSTGVNIQSWNHYHLNEPLRYERNDKGEMRSSRCFDLDDNRNCIDHFGPWVRIGCSEQPFATGAPRDFHQPVPDRTVIGAVCAECQPMGTSFAQDAIIKCACPGYADAELNLDDTHSDETDSDKELLLDSIGEVQEGFYFGDVSRGDTPDFKQCDPTWKCFPYTGAWNCSTCNETACNATAMKNNICVSGCGITSSAMVISHFQMLLGHELLYPPTVAGWMTENGYRDNLSNVSGATCNGVSHQAICGVGQAHGLTCQVNSSISVLDEWLEKGPVILHVRQRHPWTRSCKFTSGGHYIVATAVIESGSNYTIHDPNSELPERYWGTVEELTHDCSFVGAIALRRS